MKLQLRTLALVFPIAISAPTYAEESASARPDFDPTLTRMTANANMHGCMANSGPGPERCERVATTAYKVSRSSPPLWPEDVTGRRTANLLVVFTARESAGIETASGDGGEAWGATQIHWRLWAPLLESWATIGSIYDLFDMEMSMRSTLAIMRYLTKTCGSVKRAAYAYASGSCLGTFSGRKLVEARCAAIGGC